MNGAAKHPVTAWEFAVIVVLVVIGAGCSYFVYSAQRNHALNKVAASNLSSAASATMEAYYQSVATDRSFGYVSIRHLDAVDGDLHWTTGASTNPSIASYYLPSWPSKAHPEALYLAIRSAAGSCFLALQVASHAPYYLPASHESFAMGTWYSSYNGPTCQATMPASMPLSWSKNT